MMLDYSLFSSDYVNSYYIYTFSASSMLFSHYKLSFSIYKSIIPILLSLVSSSFPESPDSFYYNFDISISISADIKFLFASYRECLKLKLSSSINFKASYYYLNLISLHPFYYAYYFKCSFSSYTSYYKSSTSSIPLNFKS
jgi:hypothetical protein